jgi:hypothetical protein
MKMFLGGRTPSCAAPAHAHARAEGEDFERRGAARLAAAVERTPRQHVVQDDSVDQDVWGLFYGLTAEVVVMPTARQAAGRRVPAEGPGAADATVITEYLQQYYDRWLVPDEASSGSS